jgi:hypothetical protein
MHAVQDGLIHYRNVCQQVNVQSLEEVIKYFLKTATDRAEQATASADVRPHPLPHGLHQRLTDNLGAPGPRAESVATAEIVRRGISTSEFRAGGAGASLVAACSLDIMRRAPSRSPCIRSWSKAQVASLGSWSATGSSLTAKHERVGMLPSLAL